MKSIVYKLLLILFISLGANLSLSSSAEAGWWCRHGYCHHYHRYHCYWVGGYWAYGYWHHPRKICRWR